MKNFISIKDLKVAYGSTEVLHSIDLAVDKGEFIALLGSSGCGKTTLLRTISGLISNKSGTIKVNGNLIDHKPAEKRNMAMVFQSYALWPHMTVAQNLSYGLKIKKLPKSEIENKVAEVLKIIRLEGFGERNITRLSGGQQQRVALGRALIVDPEILLLDEPLSNLDARTRHFMRHEIKEIQNRLGLTAIHVTHDREEAMSMADKVVILNQGTIAQIGSPEEVYLRPASSFVADFMGAENKLELIVTDRQKNAITLSTSSKEISETVIPIATANGSDGAHLEDVNGDQVVVHFRSEDVELIHSDIKDEVQDSLFVPGTVQQVSYIGGYYRYLVSHADRSFLVDHKDRLTHGSNVSIKLPAKALHIFDN